MGYGRDSRIACVIMSMFSVFILLALAFFFLSSKQQRLNQEFNQLIYASLTSYTDVQKQQIVKMAGDAKSMLSGMTSMMEVAGLSPEDQWLESYLKKMEQENPYFHLDYVSCSDWKETISEEERRRICEQILNGKKGVLDIQSPVESGNGYLFSMAEPLQNHGKVVGILFSTFQTESLDGETTKNAPFKRINTLIINPDGSILYSNNNQYLNSGNLYSLFETDGVESQNLDRMKKQFQKEESFTTSLNGDGKSYYLSVAAVGVNDWSLVNYVRSPDVMLRSEYVFSMFFGTALLLILLVIAGCSWISLLFYRQKKKFQLESQRYTVLSQFSDTLLFEYDYDTDTIEFTSNAKRRLFLENLRVSGVLKLNKGIHLMHPDDWQNGERLRWAIIGCKPDEIRYYRIRLKGQSGEYRWFSCQYKILSEANGRKSRMVGKLEDITDQLGREEMLINRARKDPLTGVYNRSGEQIINRKLALQCMGIFFMIDLDNFKEINDSWGHSAGDQVLTRVAGDLDQLVNGEGIVVRVGGDEFVIFIPNSLNVEQIISMAESILMGINHPEESDHEVIGISASIGIAIAPKDGSTYEELYNAADKAMYYIKQNSKKGFAFYKGDGKEHT